MRFVCSPPVSPLPSPLSILFVRFCSWEGYSYSVLSRLSILFVRFIRKGEWDEQKRRPFNSLCEIHCPLPAVSRGIVEYSFQFSLWDSWEYKGGDEEPWQTFQFSLWDSITKIDILIATHENFQFSLWDSGGTILLIGLFVAAFNSLCEILCPEKSQRLSLISLSILFVRFRLKGASQLLLTQLSILFVRFKHVFSSLMGTVTGFQFSLWDSSWNSRDNLRCFESFQFCLWDSLSLLSQQRLSIFPFNSLCEIRQGESRVEREGVCFQFSLWDSS